MSGRRVVFMGVRPAAPFPRARRVPLLRVSAFDQAGMPVGRVLVGTWRTAKRVGANLLRDAATGHVTIAVQRARRRRDEWDVRLARGHGEPHWQRVASVELVEVEG
jgi:hypothetical protein